MTPRSEDLLTKSMMFSAEERADIAAELLASLDEYEDEPADVEAAWATEIERRARRVLEGRSQGTPWEEIRQAAYARLGEA